VELPGKQAEQRAFPDGILTLAAPNPLVTAVCRSFPLPLYGHRVANPSLLLHPKGGLMHKKVRLFAGVASALLLATVMASCDDDDITGIGGDTYTAGLSAANERPIGASTATGTGTVVFVDNGTSIDWTMTLNNVTGVTQSHIHAPATVDQNASVIINLFMPNGPTGTVNGVVARGTITDANNANFSLAAIRVLFNNGTAYANIHTSQVLAGAIRGQITRD